MDNKPKETLKKMVLYPVQRIMVRAVNAMLSFVNEHTRKKFIITDDLFLVCKGERNENPFIVHPDLICSNHCDSHRDKKNLFSVRTKNWDGT